jgi:hypothetical protein
MTGTSRSGRRPSGPGGQVRDQRLVLRFAPAELAQLQRVAGGVPLSTLARDLLLWVAPRLEAPREPPVDVVGRGSDADDPGV